MALCRKNGCEKFLFLVEGGSRSENSGLTKFEKERATEKKLTFTGDPNHHKAQKTFEIMELLKRIDFTFRMLLRYRHELSLIFRRSLPHGQLLHLSLLDLKEQGISVLVLDFDGVLAAHGENQPIEELHEWLQECTKMFSHVFVLSNQCLSRRVAYFERHYPQINYLTDVRRKPYPDGLEKILMLTKQPAHAVMLVDDRLLTGALAACITHVQFTYITHPYCNWLKRPVQELFFTLLRFLERRLVA